VPAAGDYDAFYYTEAEIDAAAYLQAADLSGYVQTATDNTYGAATHQVFPQHNDPVTPTIAFGDGDSGFYETSDNIINLSIAGVARFRIFDNYIDSTVGRSFAIRNAVGTVAAPTYAFRLDTDTGVTSITADELSLVAGGVEGANIQAAATTFPGTVSATGAVTGSNLNVTNWDTAYGWGDHSGLYSLAAHVHEGTEIDATAVTDGWVLTADGAGNAAWEAAAGGGLSNIVEDVSPQLGADLQSNTFDIDMADNDFVTFGTSRDVAMGWDGTDLEVTGTANWTMNLRDGCNLTVYGSSDTNYIRIDNNNTDGYIYTNSGDIALLRSGVSALTTQAHTDTGHTSSAQVGKHDLTFEDVGFNALPIFNDDVSDTLEASHSGHINIKELTTARTLTLCASGDLDFPVEHVTHVANVATNDYTITEGATTTLYLVDPGTGLTDTTGGCTIGPGGFATIWRRSATVYWIWGSEITA
jgi:hypothetical protein